MKITHLRNATSIIEYANKKFLIDPMLGEKGSFPPFPNSPRQELNNPLVELPMPTDQIIQNIDAIIVTHLHLDHFDETAQSILPKDLPMIAQNEEDAIEIRNVGFKNVYTLNEFNLFSEIDIIGVEGQHGHGDMATMAGTVSGIIFKNEKEKTLYIAGDTVWYEGVEKNINTHQPDVIIVNGGDNQFHEGGSLVMCEEDIHELKKHSPNSEIVVVHMEAVNHWNLSRKDLKEYLKKEQLFNNITIPEDGEVLNF